MTLANIRKKIESFISIFARISVFEHFRGDWAYEEPIFLLRGIYKKFLCKMLTMALLDGILGGFSKFRLFILENCILIWDFGILFENYGVRWLSIRRNDFIAGWEYAENV
jgi:hypothetical protein